MANLTVNPGNSQTPDATLGGGAVSGPSNTGYTSTTLNADDGQAFTDSIRWFAVPVVVGLISATLKLDFSENGSLSGVGSKNNFHKIEYSINGGGSWITLQNHVAITSLATGSLSAALTLPQDTSLVQVRASLGVSTSVVGTHSDITTSVSNVRIEAVTTDPGAVWIG